MTSLTNATPNPKLPDDVLSAARNNLSAATRLHAAWQPQAKLVEADGLLLMQGSLPLPLPFQSHVQRLDTSVAPDALLARAAAFFGGSSNPFAVLTHANGDADLNAHLAQAGFHAQSRLPEMMLCSPVSMDTLPDLPDGWHIKWAAAPEDVEAFVAVSAAAYETLGLPAMFTPMYFGHRPGLLTDHVSIALACDPQGGAHAAAMVVHTGTVAGIYWVGAMPEARGRGLASACTAAVANVALARGAMGVTLQATPMGEPVYRRLGFIEHDLMTRWSR